MDAEDVTSVFVDGENDEVSYLDALEPYTHVGAQETIEKRAEIWYRDRGMNQSYRYHTQEPEQGLNAMHPNQSSHFDGVKQVEWTQVKTRKTTFDHGSPQKTETSTKNSVKFTLNDGQSYVSRGGGYYGGSNSQNWYSSDNGGLDRVAYYSGGRDNYGWAVGGAPTTAPPALPPPPNSYKYSRYDRM